MRLADRMIAFARNRHGAPVAIDVALFVAQQSAFLRHASSSKITIASDVSPTFGTILVDRSALENALLNLALNARDAMPDGGALTITARPVISPARARTSTSRPLNGLAR
jgi:nitrogen-specific signal transduction histidine kinase